MICEHDVINIVLARWRSLVDEDVLGWGNGEHMILSVQNRSDILWVAVGFL